MDLVCLLDLFTTLCCFSHYCDRKMLISLVLFVRFKKYNICLAGQNVVHKMSQGALDRKLGKHVRCAKKLTGPLYVQTLWEILRTLTLISAN